MESSEKCPTCGTTSIKFDPPLAIDVQEISRCRRCSSWAASVRLSPLKQED